MLKGLITGRTASGEVVHLNIDGKSVSKNAAELLPRERVAVEGEIARLPLLETTVDLSTVELTDFLAREGGRYTVHDGKLVVIE